MKTYEQVLAKVELALEKGEYNFCIQFLHPIIESFPLSTKEGVNLRTILITALCGINKKEEAKKICNELLKSYDYRTRENAKYLMEIIDSPTIKKPENWNLQFENYLSPYKKSLNSPKLKKNNEEQKKFINVTNTPTGETKPFQKGFTIIIFIILFMLIPLLSGCMKIENTLDISEIESINNQLRIESKYINKFPWQLKFEDTIKEVFPDSQISSENSIFDLKNKNLSLDDTKTILKKIDQTAGETAGFLTDLKINNTEKNLLFFKKYYYKMDFDLTDIPEIEDLEISFKIIHPNKFNINDDENPPIEISNNLTVWHLILGEKNSLEFSFLSWNKLLIGITFIILIIIIFYFIRFYRFKLGTDLPQLPSN